MGGGVSNSRREKKKKKQKKDKMGDPLAQHTAVGAISSVFRMVANGNMYPARSLWLLSPLFFLTDRFGTLSGVLHDFLSLSLSVCVYSFLSKQSKNLCMERESCVSLCSWLYIFYARDRSRFHVFLFVCSLLIFMYSLEATKI